MGAHDVVEGRLGPKAERERAARIEVAGPAGDDPLDRRVGLAADERRRLAPATPLERRDLVADGRRTPGIVRFRRAPSAERSMSAACRKNPTAERGLACQWRTSSRTGSTASSPTSGSRMMLEKKPDAALFGFPGRTQMVGRRSPIPSKKPRRE